MEWTADRVRMPSAKHDIDCRDFNCLQQDRAPLVTVGFFQVESENPVDDARVHGYLALKYDGGSPINVYLRICAMVSQSIG